MSAPTDDVEIGEEVSASVSAPVGDVEDSDEAVEGVDVQEAAEPRGEADEIVESATRLSEDAVDLIAGESSVSDALEDEVSVLTDDVKEIGEEFLESVSAPVGDVEDRTKRLRVLMSKKLPSREVRLTE